MYILFYVRNSSGCKIKEISYGENKKISRVSFFIVLFFVPLIFLKYKFINISWTKHEMLVKKSDLNACLENNLRNSLMKFLKCY